MNRLAVATSLAAAALASLASLASPAAAQAYHDVPYPDRDARVAPGQDLGGQLDALEARLQRGIAGGAIDRDESARALNEIASIRHEFQEERQRHDGRLGEDDRLRLQGRLDHLDRSIRWMHEERERGLRPTDGARAPGGWDRDRFWTGAPVGPFERVGWLRDRIERGIGDGSLDRGQARRAFGELHAIEATARRMNARDGGRLTTPDAAYLQSRLDHLSRSLRWAERRGD